MPKDKLLIRVESRILTTIPTPQLTQYRNNPLKYAETILRVQLTPAQQVILQALPGRVKVSAGHSVGKTFVAAAAVNWWFDTRDPGLILTTAPTEREVVDLLWREVRLQRTRAGLSMPFTGPIAPEMRTSPAHFARGFTARKGESFQGRHGPDMLFVFDEDEGIDPIYYLTTDTMFAADQGHGWLSIGNPTTNHSQSYAEDQIVQAHWVR